VVYPEDNEMAILKKGKPIKVRNISDDIEVDPYIEKLKWNLENIQKRGYDHFMLKEIFEQPQAISNALRGEAINVRESNSNQQPHRT
jgi:glucosamine--fructose-6-phosphate aminotransferase (isomerizing)